MRPSFLDWAESSGGLYLFDKKVPTLAVWPPYFREILNHLFPGGDGLLPYNQICWSTVKKSGKSELAAGLHIWFALYVDIPGEQYVIANDFEGAKARVFKAIEGALQKNPHLHEKDHWEVSRNEIRFDNGSLIRAIPVDFRGEAGGNQSFVSVDEPWGIIQEGGIKMMSEFVPVPTREFSTIFYAGYQGFKKQSDFWHNLLDVARVQGEPVPELAHLEDGDGQPACWHSDRLFVLWDHVGRMPWHTPGYLNQRKATAYSLGEYLRMWENRRTDATDAFCTPEQWDKLYDPLLRALHTGDERPIVLAADAATKSDCTALVGTTFNAVTQKVEVVYCQVWRPLEGPIKLTETVGPEIVRLHREHKVLAVVFDPFQMAAIGEMCARAGVRMVEFPQTARRIEADTHLRQLIIGGNLAHYGDETLKAHVTNAAARESERGLRLVKELSSAKIDAAVALSMSALAAVERLARGKVRLATQENPFYAG
jgi:hypothetical protein